MRWVFKLKYSTDPTSAIRTIARYKARLVILGNHQKHGIDYDETYAPVLRMEAFRLLMTIAAILDYEIHNMDVVTAFLNGFIDFLLHVKPPPGFEDLYDPNHVLRVLKSVYGLKQSPRMWYITLVNYLLSLGYNRLIKDRCIFVKIIDGYPIFIGVYVDDLIILAPCVEIMGSIKADFSTRFSMHDLGELKSILGFHIIRDRAAKTITLHQSQYATAVVQRFGYGDCNPVPTPVMANLKLSTSMCALSLDDIHYMKDKPYRSVVGSLMYLMTGTRPDLAYLVQQLSQFLNNPGPEHWNAAVRGLRYLKGTLSLGLTLGGPSSPHGILHAYSDSDFASCVDTRRCIGGYVTFAFNSCISWVAKKLRSVVLSTTEAEYMFLCLLAQESLYMKQLLAELGFKIDSPITLFVDNQSTILVVKNPALHGRSKHVDVKYHFIKDLVEQQVFIVTYVSTKEQLADIFTKPLDKPTFENLRSQLGLRRIEIVTESQ
jgi:hypothetical protein